MERGTFLSFCYCFILVLSTGVKHQYVIDIDGNDGKSEIYLIDLDRNITKDADKDAVDTDDNRFSEEEAGQDYSDYYATDIKDPRDVLLDMLKETGGGDDYMDPG